MSILMIISRDLMREILYFSRDMANFEPLLATLDNNKERLKIKSYGISDTTLEEVNRQLFSIDVLTILLNNIKDY